ncbi:pyridoxamine 5'-phosphate oxidase family protein [Paracoccus luteus]|uniref:pyridoxamine 5'-phosphate oxidase family protein n=1 Tax=Paracoccus luteus TaxID=2508543 RepID=UPI0010701181|nr:pyridoxamine 5'-phosphate oxidase family protein [Paracoccus luteus]
MAGTTPTADDRATFWQRLDGINAGMLGCAPDWRLVPMSHYADPDQGALWFITAEGVHIEKALRDGPQQAVHAVGDGSGKLYARIEGQLSLSNDAAKLDELWNTVAASWFEDGKRDDDIRLLKLTLTEAEVWATDSGLAFLYQVAKARLTGAEPDMGDHFQVRFT